MLVPIFGPRMQEALDTGERYDAKTALQEVVVRATGSAPLYRVSSSGPDHDKRFDAHVFVEGELFGTGNGRSKKQAEYGAARAALGRFAAAGEVSQQSEERGPDARAS